MNSVTSLLDFILNLLRDPHKQAEFRQHPERMLADHGLHGVSASDIHETLPLVTDHRAVQLGADHGAFTPPPTPPPVFPAPGESETHCAIRYLDHITKVYSYNIDNHTTAIDDSVHENIWALGDVNQAFDDTNVMASGHAVAAGDGIWGGAVTTGDENAIGTGNAVGLGNFTGGDNALGSMVGNDNALANGYGSVAGNDNSVLTGSHDVQGDGNVTGPVIGSQVATTDGTIANDNHLVSDSGNHSAGDSGNVWAGDSGNSDLHSFGAGSTNTIGSDNLSVTAINSGASSDSHNFSDVTNSTDTSMTSGADDQNGTQFDHGFGNGAMGGSMSGADDQNGTQFDHGDHHFDHGDHHFEHDFDHHFEHDFDHHFEHDFDHGEHDFDHGDHGDGDHGHGVGDSYGDNYGNNSLQGNCDSHDSGMQLNIH